MIIFSQQNLWIHISNEPSFPLQLTLFNYNSCTKSRRAVTLWLMIMAYRLVNRRFITLYGIITSFLSTTCSLAGTFCMAALKGKVDIEVQVTKYLGGDITILTTHCALRELFSLGPQVSGAHKILKKFKRHRWFRVRERDYCDMLYIDL